MLDWKTKGTELYQQLPHELNATLKPCAPLRSIEPDRKKHDAVYTTWKK